MKHWIAMAGLSGGYMPNYCDVFEEYENAVQSLADIHDLGKTRTMRLRKNGYLSMNMNGTDGEIGLPPQPADGNEYCEIIECDCDEPHIHSENKVDWCDCPECKPDNESEEQMLLKPGDNATLDVEAYLKWYMDNIPLGDFLFDNPNVWIEDLSNKSYGEEPGYAINSGDSGFSESGIGCAYVPAKFLTPRK